VGRRGETALFIDPVIDVASAIGLVAALRAPRNPFLLAWAAAPVAWLVQDPSRFLLHWPFCGAVLGAVALAPQIERLRPRIRAAAVAALVVAATIPGLVAEADWLGTRYPRMIDWSELGAAAAAVRRAGADDRLVSGFGSWIPSAVAVWEDIDAERGHWVEVRPRVDPAEEIGVAGKVYVLAIPPDDEVLAAWAARGWVRVQGGGRWSAVVVFPARPSLADAGEALRRSWARDAAWVADRCERNSLGNPFALFARGEVEGRRQRRRDCQRHVTRMQVAALVYAHAREADDPSDARAWRRHARWLGWMAALAADESTLDFRSEVEHARMREDMADIARAADADRDVAEPLVRMLDRYVGAQRDAKR
jgi:hypothetical protein